MKGEEGGDRERSEGMTELREERRGEMEGWSAGDSLVFHQKMEKEDVEE